MMDASKRKKKNVEATQAAEKATRASRAPPAAAGTERNVRLRLSFIAAEAPTATGKAPQEQATQSKAKQLSNERQRSKR
jgi:hypothetical protein